MQLGISSYTYTWAIGVPGYPVPAPLTAPDLMEKARALGVSLVQIADNLPLHALDEPALAALADDVSSGMQIEVGTRGIRPDHLAVYLALARRFRSPIVRVVIDTPDHHPTFSEALALFDASLPAFADAGVILAIENHDRFSVRAFAQIMETFDSPYLGICLDTVNSFGALEGPEAVVDALGPWTVNLHIKDFSIRRADHMMGFTIEGTPAGQGRLDIPWLLEKLDAYRCECSAILELWTPPEPDIPTTLAKESHWAQSSIKHLRQILPLT